MKQQLRFLILLVMFLPTVFLNGQTHNSSTNCPGVPGACGYPASSNNSNQRSGPNQSPQNGNGTLGVIYDQARCGLDFTTASQRLGRRGSLNGVLQPAPFVISGIPACAVIEKAYLWAEGSANGAAQTATIAGPFGTASYPLAIVGQGPDKCWGYAGTYTYRADVTPIVGGNGTYNISGINTNPPIAGNDMDGATLIVIWSLPTAAWQGRIVIADGAYVVNGGVATYNMPLNPTVCGVTSNARAFIGVGDIQFNPGSWSANGTAIPLGWNWWDFRQVNTTVAVAQATSTFQVNTGGDCFNLCIAGLYFRTTTCATCPSASAATATVTSTPTTCSNCNGSATVTITPAGSYTYSWSPAPGSGGNTATPSGMCAGTYTVTATSACGTVTATVNIPVSGGGITLNSVSQTNLVCNGQCTGATVTNVIGGSGPYVFSWSPAATNSTVIGTNTSSGLCAGTYTVSAIDANGCTGSMTYSITQPPVLSFTQSQVNVSCNNACDATGSVVASGGSGSYTYNWSPAPGGGQGTANASGLCAGIYTCTIADAAAPTCTITATFNITQLAALSSTQSQTDVTCFNYCDGTAAVVSSGGTGTYSYNWLPAPGSGQGTANAGGLCPGSYICTVTDGNGCTMTATFNITQPPQLTTTGTQTDVTCNGTCNGTASVIALGGTGSYSYNWSPAPGGGQGTANATGLCVGGYTCTVTDANNCSTTATFTITEPPLLTLTAAGFNVTCFGVCDGQVVVIPAGGTPNYSFSWSNACNAASCNNICAGSYTVIVTDANGCTATESVTVTQPTDISISTSTVDANCGQSDGSATATYSGGTGTLNAVWYNPQQAVGATYSNIPSGNYFVVVTDQNGCDDTVGVTLNNLPGVVASVGPVANVSCFSGSNGSVNILDNNVNPTYTYSWSPNVSTSSNATGLGAGQYIVTLTDAAGCTSTVTATVTQPTQVTISATATPGAVCSGTPIALAATGAGGTPGYQFAWSPGPLIGANQNITPLASGSYTAYITDANNCVDSTTVSFVVNPVPVAALTGDVLAGCAPLCVNFTDGSTVGGNGTINQWYWDFGDGFTSTSQNPTHCYSVAGTYSVTLTVTTSDGCTNTIVMPNYINVFAIPVAEFTFSPIPATELNPTIYFTDQSIGAASWNWAFGDVTNASSSIQNPSFTYPGPGCFDVVLTVTSTNGCTDTTVHEACVDPDVSIFVPNAFTPNGDGMNEIFFAQGIGIDPNKFELWVFDRWGNLIFYTTDMNEGWNGKVQGASDICQVDTYVWKIRAIDMLDKKHTLIGHVNLIR